MLALTGGRALTGGGGVTLSAGTVTGASGTVAFSASAQHDRADEDDDGEQADPGAQLSCPREPVRHVQLSRTPVHPHREGDRERGGLEAARGPCAVTRYTS